MKAVVFDLGGTLMRYADMPYSWVDYYEKGFDAIVRKYGCRVSGQDLARSVELLKGFNPRISGRVIEYSPEHIFSAALAHWNLELPLSDTVDAFWEALELRAEVYADTLAILDELRRVGCVLAALTDLPSALPDARFRRDIPQILDRLDLYVSSAVCGYRKPDPRGLEMIAETFGMAVSELIFVGDEEKDRQTAQNAGCRFIQIDREGKTPGSLQDLTRLPELI